MIHYMRTCFSNMARTGKAAPRNGAKPGGGNNAPTGLFPTKGSGPNDYIYITCSRANPEHWSRLAKLIGREELIDDPRFVDLEARRAHGEECVAELRAEFAVRTFAEWKALLAQIDAPWAPVQAVEELLEDPQVLANDYLGEVVVDGGPSYRLPTVPVQFDGQPPALRRAPEHGEHSELVLLELGYTWEQIGELRDGGVIP
jgi:crotonobetainyl-CoA:carnitine CoA-transferase CaiB-like acyl-CoA transferase